MQEILLDLSFEKVRGEPDFWDFGLESIEWIPKTLKLLQEVPENRERWQTFAVFLAVIPLCWDTMGWPDQKQPNVCECSTGVQTFPGG